MKTGRTASIIIFIIFAVAIIWLAVWYNNKIAMQAQSAVIQQNVAAEQVVQQAQQKLMQELKIKDTVVGTGATAETGDTVTVNYTGTLNDGTKFDSSLNPGRTPFVFPLGAGQVIQGWDLGVVGMKVGGTRELTIPPALGYGANAFGPIPANSTLHFTITLLAVSTSTPTSTSSATSTN